jgi:hypothetical protein
MHMAPQDGRDEDLMMQMVSSAEPAPQAEDPLDDVFGSDPGSPVFESEPDTDTGAWDTLPSDVRRLQTEHITAGYRDGITVAKGQSIQAGFDEGFSLGAEIGLKAGQVLGFLEGIIGALRSGNEEDHRQAQQLLADARKELSTDEIYDQKFWAPDGTWKFTLQSQVPESDVVFADVAAAHPLIAKWCGILDAQISKRDIRREVLMHMAETPAAAVAEKKEVKVEQQQPRERLEW